MRFVEASILMVILVTVAGWFVGREHRPRWFTHLPLAALVLVVVHVFVEGYRWQMVPAYATVGLLLVIAAMRTRAVSTTTSSRSGVRIAGRIFGGMLACVGLAMVAAPPLAFPVFEMPKPTGPHQVGTLLMRFVDDSRPEIFTPDPNDHRDLAVQAWYPALPAPDAKPAPFWVQTSIVGPSLAGGLGMPGFLFDHLNLIPSHSHVKAVVSDVTVQGGA